MTRSDLEGEKQLFWNPFSTWDIFLCPYLWKSISVTFWSRFVKIFGSRNFVVYLHKVIVKIVQSTSILCTMLSPASCERIDSHAGISKASWFDTSIIIKTLNKSPYIPRNAILSHMTFVLNSMWYQTHTAKYQYQHKVKTEGS